VPELPETETIARDLNAAISGRTIIAVHVTRPDVLREVTAPEFRRRVRGTSITRVWRRAKLVILDLSSGDRIVVQPRFTGALLIDHAGSLPASERR
jgi:formamidopyrimidine-DNA glycosylase